MTTIDWPPISGKDGSWNWFARLAGRPYRRAVRRSLASWLHALLWVPFASFELICVLSASSRPQLPAVELEPFLCVPVRVFAGFAPFARPRDSPKAY